MIRQTSKKPVVKGLDAVARRINGKIARNEPLTMQELSIVKSRNPSAYSAIIAKAFQDRHDAFGKRRFSLRGISDRAKEVQFNNQSIAQMKTALATASNKTDKKLVKIQELEEQYQKAHDAYLVAKNAFELVSSDLERARAELDGLRENESTYSKECRFAQDVAAELSKEVLVHRTATMYQLRKFQHRIMIVTSVDEYLAKSIGCAEVVFDEADLKPNLLPSSLYGREWTEEESSAVAFAGLVIQYQEASPEVEYIYSSRLVADILRLNGYKA